MVEQKVILEDDAKEPMKLMLEHRLPWLVVGLFGGIGATLLSARFEPLLKENIQLSFFIPVIVYMANAVGQQTEQVYIRNLTKKRAKFSVYFVKEMLVGTTLGLLFGTIMGSLAFLWFRNADTALAVGLSMSITMTVAPLLGLVIPTILWKEHEDPAIGAGPFTTVIQDVFNLLIYFYIASFIILH